MMLMTLYQTASRSVEGVESGMGVATSQFG